MRDVLVLWLVFLLLAFFSPTLAATGINEQLNFQGKLVNTNGTNITDGTYNMEFKIYQDGDGVPGGGDETLKWTESRLRNNSQGVTVTNGVFRVSLGSVTAFASSIDWNQSILWLSINVGNTNPTCTPFSSCVPDGEMNPFVRLSAAPYALNALKVAGLTVTNTTGTLTIPNSTTISFAGAFTTSGASALTLTTTGTTSVTLPTGGTLLTNTTSANQTLTSTQTSGTILGIADSTGLAGAIVGQSITLSGTGVQDQTGLQLNLSGATGTNLNDIVGTGSTWKVSNAGVLTVVSCTGCGGGGGTLQQAYDAGSAGDQVVTLDATQDSMIVRNPSASGSDSTFTFKVEQLNTGIANDALYVDNRGTGSSFRIDDVSGDTTPFIVDAEGRVGIGTSAISANAATERLLQVGSETNRGNSTTYGEILSKGLDRHTALTGIKDIYVYDTTSDSDGGRWVDWATTDNLSWYSESLDDGPNDPCVIATDDRCYKKSFPRKAILVVTTDALYIFDSATNDMWMKFSQNASGFALGVDTNNDPSSVTALNGVIYVGANGSASGGLYTFDFMNDRMWNYDATDKAAADVGISGRNAAVTYNVDSNLKLQLDPVGTSAEWMNVNDVYATVMSRSLSAVTALGGATNTNPGYGKVYVALATDSGATVINMSDKVLLQYSDVAADDYTAVAISSKGFLYALNTTQDQLERWDTIDTDKTSEVAGTYTRKWDETVATGPALATTAFNIIPGMPDNLEIAERAAINLDIEDVIYVGHSLGLAELHDHTTQAFGWVKHFNSTRQSPMMPLAGINDVVLPLDDTSGTQAQDLSLTNTDMAIFGTPTLGVNGVQGKAINFDNTDDFLCSDADSNNVCDVDTAFNMSTVGWTINLWFKHSATPPASGVDMIFEKCVTTAPAQAIGCVAAYMTTTGTVVVANDDTDAVWTQGSSYDITATSTYTYNDNQWHMLTITRTNVNDVDSWIDAQGMNLSTATGNTLTFDGSQIVTIGASCSTTTGAACAAANALNFWDGQIDDFQYIVGTTTQATITQLYVRRLFNSERPRATKKTITVTDATSATSTSLTDTGEAWDANEFAGQIVEITGSTDADCVGLTRRISSNTATSMTFTPAVPGTCTMDTSADFQVDPEALYGASDAIAGVGITAESPLGEARQLCVGTNSATDTGGITCYNHQAGPSIVADVYHSQASQTDDSGTDWTGTDFDDMRAVDLSTRTLVMASEAHFTSVTEDVRLGQGLDYVANQLYMIRQEIVLDGITAVGSTGPEIGFSGGADLAEYYTSDEALEKGEVIAMDPNVVEGIKRSTKAYQGDVLGVVATSPGIILGESSELSYPVALVGRVPVKVSTESGMIKAGDYVTASSIPGYGMKAIKAGRVLGKALEDLKEENLTDCTVDGEVVPDKKCGTITVFVNLTNSLGSSPIQLTASGSGELGLMSYLDQLKEQDSNPSATLSEIFTDRVSAAESIISPKIIVDSLFAKMLKVDGETIFEKAVNFLANVVFKGRVSFEKVAIYNQDTAGFAKIKRGERYVDISFNEEYLYDPIVNVALDVPTMTQEIYEQKIVDGNCTLLETKEECEQKLTEELFGDNVNFAITRRSTKGFLILLDKPAKADVTFSWIAIAVKDAKTATKTSLENLFKINAQDQNQLTPVVSPIPSLTPAVVTPTETTPSPTETPNPQE